MTLSAAEQRVCAAIAADESGLVELVQTLVRFDTTSVPAGEAARDDAALQGYLGERLAAAGAAVALAEPAPELIAGHRMIPDGFSFTGRPQLVARFPAHGDGRTLLLNGHIDVVAATPERWTHDPFAAVVADGRVHGRGSCDMKGGVACMVFAAETIARLRIPLAGELIVNTVTDEEATGAGGLVSARTLTADAAIVPEPTGLDVWIACRGSLLPTITIDGRAGHAGIAPRHHEHGGAVNAIEKTALILEAIRLLREDWALRPRHPYLSPADCVPTMIRGGEWIVSHPAHCQLNCHIHYLPEQADEHGWGSLVQQEFSDWISRAAHSDPWLARHPPRIDWARGDVPPATIDPAQPIVETALAAVRATGHASVLGGLDNWHDGATLTVEAKIPAICLGPGDIQLAHTTNESVPIRDLVACTQALAITAMRYCAWHAH